MNRKGKPFKNLPARPPLHCRTLFIKILTIFKIMMLFPAMHRSQVLIV